MFQVTAAILLPSEEVLVNSGRGQRYRPGTSYAVRLVAGPYHFVDCTKPFWPGSFVVENGEHHGRQSIQIHDVFEAHGRSVEERGIHGAAGEAHGSASKGC